MQLWSLWPKNDASDRKRQNEMKKVRFFFCVRLVSGSVGTFTGKNYHQKRKSTWKKYKEEVYSLESRIFVYLRQKMELNENITKNWNIIAAGFWSENAKTEWRRPCGIQCTCQKSQAHSVCILLRVLAYLWSGCFRNVAFFVVRKAGEKWIITERYSSRDRPVRFPFINTVKSGSEAIV